MIAKLKNTVGFFALAAAFAAVPASAIEWQALPLTSHGAEILDAGTLLYAYCYKGSDGAYTANGVSFYNSGYLTGVSSELEVSPAFTDHSDSFGNEGLPEDDEFGKILKKAWRLRKTAGPQTFTFKGFEVGRTYKIQFIIHNRHTSIASPATATVSAAEGATVAYGGEGWPYGGTLVGTFVATGATETVTLTYGGEADAYKTINAVQVRDYGVGGHGLVKPNVLPLKGLVLWPGKVREHPELKDSIALEFAYVKPSDVVTGMDEDENFSYDWSSFENTLNDIASRGHQTVMRVRYVYPGEHGGTSAVPDCIKNSSGYHETYAADPGGDGPTYYADWSCPLLERFTLKFFRALAERYDDDPRLAFLQVGFGHWAEYHISGTELNLGVNFPTKAFQKQFLTTVGECFTNTPHMISIDAAATERTPIVGDAEVFNLGFGLFDDSFMQRQHELSDSKGYNERNWIALGYTNRWQGAPNGGEISYFDDGYDQLHFLMPGGIHGVTWAQAAAKYHITFMTASDSPDGDYATPERFKSASEECGWDCRVSSVVANGNSVTVKVMNYGVAAVYHDIRVRCGEETSTNTLKGILPGEERTFTFSQLGILSLVSAKLLKPVLLDVPEIEIGYPEYIPDDSGAKQRYDAWTARFGADQNSAWEKAFLLDCAMDADVVAASNALFRIVGITVDGDDVDVRVTGNAGEGDPYGNGFVHIFSVKEVKFPSAGADADFFQAKLLVLPETPTVK